MSTNDTLTAKANEGSGTDALATLNLGSKGKAGRVALIIDDGTDTPPNAGAANPLPVSMDGGATEAKQDAQQATLGAIETAADALLIAADAIKIAAESLNTKTIAVDTGAIAGTVALDAPTLAALETVNAAVSNFPATQPISAAALPLPADAATETTLALLKAATDALVSATASINAQAETTTTLLAAIFEKMPRVTSNDQAVVSVELLPTLSALTTLTTLANQNAMGGKFISGDNAMLAGTAHIYNQITVS